MKIEHIKVNVVPKYNGSPWNMFRMEVKIEDDDGILRIAEVFSAEDDFESRFDLCVNKIKEAIFDRKENQAKTPSSDWWER